MLTKLNILKTNKNHLFIHGRSWWLAVEELAELLLVLRPGEVRNYLQLALRLETVVLLSLLLTLLLTEVLELIFTVALEPHPVVAHLAIYTLSPTTAISGNITITISRDAFCPRKKVLKQQSNKNTTLQGNTLTCHNGSCYNPTTPTVQLTCHSSSCYNPTTPAVQLKLLQQVLFVITRSTPL